MSEGSKKSWLVVGDGAAAEFYSIHAIPLRLTRVPVGILFISKDSDHAAVHNSDARHKAHIGKHHGSHDKHQNLLIERVVDALRESAQEKHFDDVIVVLPPKAIAHFRAVLPDALKAKIKQEITADWTHLSTPELEKHLARHLPFAPA